MLTITSVAVFFLLTSGVSAAGPPTVNLGVAGDFAILTKTGITTTGVTSVTGDMGSSPIAAAAMTGFALVMDPTTTFSTSALVTGQVFAADYTNPTNLANAIGDMGTAYTDAAGRVTPDYNELYAGAIGGETLAPGLYKWGTSVGITGDVTFHGGADDVWILQIGQSLSLAAGAGVTLTGGAQAKNIFWQIAGETTAGTGSNVKGVILCQTKIVFKTGSSMVGRALAQTAVTLDSTVIVQPSSRRLRGAAY